MRARPNHDEGVVLDEMTAKMPVAPLGATRENAVSQRHLEIFMTLLNID
jgi:hypothetical protein